MRCYGGGFQHRRIEPCTAGMSSLALACAPLFLIHLLIYLFFFHLRLPGVKKEEKQDQIADRAVGG